MTGKGIKLQLDVLERDGYGAARTMLVRLLDMDEKERGLMRIRTEAACGAGPKKIRAMWTGWAMCHQAMPGTPDYEAALRSVLEDMDGDAGVPGEEYMSEYVREAWGLTDTKGGCP